MKTKQHLVEQRDRFNQQLTLDLELENGDKLNLNNYVAKLLSTQSLEAWNGRPDDLRDWLALCVSQYITQAVLVKIWGHGN